MANPNNLSKVFLAVLSMVVSVVTWSIVCYSFVVNCVLLLSIILSPSDKKSLALEDLGLSIDDEYSVFAAILLFYSLRLVCEIASCILLVIQFLSSYEFTLCSNDEDNQAADGYERNWKRCHKNVLIWSLGIFAITGMSALSGLSPILFFEIAMLALNLIFLFVVLLFHFLIDEGSIVRYEGESSNGSCNYIVNEHFQNFPEKTPSYNIAVNSFVDSSISKNDLNVKPNDLNTIPV